MRAAFSKAEIESRFAGAFKLTEKPPLAVVSTGILEVDSLSGGIPRGAITEIFGSASSGRTSLMLSMLGRATTHEEVCALIDTNDVFDPLSAANAGMNLERLLWVRCGAKMEYAFKATDLLLQGGGFGLIGLDIGDVPPRDAQRIISSWWHRFRRVVENTPTALIVLAQESCVRSCAALALELKTKEMIWSQPRKGSETEGDVGRQTKKFVLSPVFKSFNQLAFSPVTQSNLLRASSICVERQRPVASAVRQVQFRTRTL